VEGNIVNGRAWQAVCVWAGVLTAELGAPGARGQDGAVVGWGEQVIVPQSRLTELVGVATGFEHSLGLTADGSIVAWGNNDFGQCNVSAPNNGFVAVAGRGSHRLGLKAFYGDLNCDGTVDFADINPFVRYLSNFAGWQAAFPHCHALNGDINADGTYGQGSFGDINPFIALLTGG
jgi:hypothetical protein